MCLYETTNKYFLVKMTDEEEAIREEEAEENKEAETDTMDIYKDKELEEMLENDEITEAEYSFMLGREKRKKKNTKTPNQLTWQKKNT